ncbi:hypothetical protein LSH36_489g00006 [Paralvinella palmiformis]|uniref:Phosphatidylinositol-3,4,5-trisphosphate 3-phosphatase n=1 Tax=Paralvinella palmiformis TaxID=53620 RepID=A0AAD9MYQ2_9ANNE|nr:hypothetical protein LSH36_489g00006 [Paralvinella palmiformis]
MAENYQRFVDADTEIILNENDDCQNDLEMSSPDGINRKGVTSRLGNSRNDDIGPANNKPEDDATHSTKYRQLANENETESQVIIPSEHQELDIAEKTEAVSGIRLLRCELRRFVDHLAFRIFTVLLVLLDLIAVIVDLSKNDTNRPLEILSLTIITYFVLEFSLRLIAHGPEHFVKEWLEIFDAIVIFISFIFTILPIALNHLNTNVAFIRLFVAARLIRIILIIRLVTEKKNLERATRKVVSQNKRRYQKDGFDLDLCYITHRVIAMSFPSAGFMALYRNPIKEVARFLDLKHQDNYMIFNLCSERMYDESIFQNRVARYRVDDHNVPKLRDLVDFVQTAKGWLGKDPKNVIAVHCKGGKGRTGTFICTWLVENGTFEEAKQSLDYFGDRRTDLSVGSKYQGVETPSQGRYVGYYEKIKRLHFGNMPPEQTLKLTSMYIKSLSGIGCGDGRDLTCKVITDSRIWVYELGRQDNCKVTHDLGADSIAVTFSDTPLLTGDIKVMFFCSDKSIPRGCDDCLFYFWFHTAFVEDGKLFLPREELDNPHKKRTWTVFMDDLSVTLLFKKIPTLLT